MFGAEVIGLSYSITDVDIIKTSLVPLLALVFFGGLVVMPAAVFRRWYFYYRRLKASVITAEYDPPLGLTPAELGYLFDGKLRDREIGATIIHLAQRGVIHIKRVEGVKRIYSGPKIESKLKAYECKILEEIDSSNNGVTAKDLLKRFTSIKKTGANSSPVSREFLFTQFVHSDLQKQGYVKGSFFWKFMQNSLKLSLVLMGVFVFIPLLFIWLVMIVSEGVSDIRALFVLMTFGFFFCLFFYLVFFAAAIVLNYIRGRVVGREWIVTPRLERLWPQIVGYRQYVKLVESEKLEFQTQYLAERCKNDTLSYAVALGFVKNWRKILS